jgi:alkanesulfonate monooxygenase SsuD/methylene tetrahydromethanopterin reductase-like flavin-dependent oxidoreductase (luciferase family)
MKYAIYLPNFGPLGNARVLADLAADAERAGWDGFFIWDHVARKREFGDVVDPWIALTAIALQTRSIRIGALITPLPRRRPWKVARETTSLDHLSNSRLIFATGIGSAGGSQLEWENFGEQTDLKTRGEMLDEGLAILAGLWSGQPFTFVGRHYHVSDSLFLPAPLQQPRIPVWIAGTWPNKAPLTRAARWDGIAPTFTSDDPVAELRALVAHFRDSGRLDSPFDIVYPGQTPGHDPTRAAGIIAPVAAAGATWWLEDIRPTAFGDDWATTWTLEAIRQRILQPPPR